MALSFAFGGDTGSTYDDLKRRQALAQAMWARGSGSRAPRTAMEGLNSAAQSITGALLAKKLGKQISGQEDDATMAYNGILAGLGQGQAPMGGGGSPSFAPQNPMDEAFPVGQTGPAPKRNEVTAGGKAYDMGQPADMGAFIKQGLIERGLPEHVADGFVMNFRDESGLNPGINERNPIVPGSRGGFGLAQWTGPRRKQLEAFAQQRGLPVDDPNLQMDFLVEELRGPEAKAAQSIFGAKDAGGAATAIVNNFLRPAEEHRAARASSYGGQQYAQTGGINPTMLAAMSNPALNPQQRSVLQMLMTQQMQQADPMRQLQMQNLQGQIDARNTPQRDIVTGADGYQYYTDGSRVLPNVQKPVDAPTPTTSQRDYQFYADQTRAAGQTPLSFNDWDLQSRKAGATNITNNAGSNSNIGTIPQGYAAIPDPNTDSGYRMVAIPGGPEDTSKSDAVAEENRDTATGIITNAAARAREAARGRTVGGALGSVAAWNPSSENAEVYRQVEVLQSNAKIENLTAMRAASPTGGALGAVSDKESQMLAAKSGALDPASPNFLRDLDDYERTLLQIVHGKEAGDRIYEQTRGGGTDADGWTDVGGVKIRVKQ